MTLLEVMDGLLLGDGSIDANGRLTLVQCISHKQWVDQIKQQLTDLGVVYSDYSFKFKGYTTIRGKQYNQQRSCGLRTHVIPFFKEQRLRWYPGGIKHVPLDVVLTPQSVSHWYAGDGTVGCKGYHAKFCTDGFSTIETQFLIKKLSEVFGWRPIPEKRNRILLSTFSDRISLVEMLKGLLPENFKYKLKLRIKHIRQTVHADLESRLRVMFYEKISYSRMAVSVAMSQSGVYAACQRLGLHR